MTGVKSLKKKSRRKTLIRDVQLLDHCLYLKIEPPQFSSPKTWVEKVGDTHARYLLWLEPEAWPLLNYTPPVLQRPVLALVGNTVCV